MIFKVGDYVYWTRPKSARTEIQSDIGRIYKIENSRIYCEWLLDYDDVWTEFDNIRLATEEEKKILINHLMLKEL